MRRMLSLTLAVAVASVLSVGISAAGASTKFAYTEQVADTADLVVSFEEGALKRFASVDYELVATATTMSCSGGQCIGSLHFLSANSTLTPDPVKGRTSGTLTLDIPTSPSPVPCLCAGTFQVEYRDVTLTNLTTGHVYRLDPISRDWTT
jgi:hypothetical protein